MEIEKLARKFVRFPWDVCLAPLRHKDREVADYVSFSAGGGEYFKEPPENQGRRKYLSTVIASTLFIALTNAKGVALERSKLGDLTPREREDFLQMTGIAPEDHESVLCIVRKPALIPSVASYIAAAYAFTTYMKPFVADFDKIMSIAMQAQRDTTQDEKNLRSAGLLILTDLGSPCKMNENAYGFLQSILTQRAFTGRMNMFIDIPRGNLLKLTNSRLRPSREDVIEHYVQSFPASYRMDSHLAGFGVHMPFIDSNMGETNERRKTSVI